MSLMARKFTPREKAVFSLVSFLVGLLLLDRLIFSPLSNRLERLDARIVSREARLRKETLILARKERSREEFESYAPNFQKPQAGANGMTTFLKRIESCARASGVHIMDVKPEPVRTSAPSAYSAVVLVEAAWEPMAKFIMDVERPPALLRIEKASLQAKQNDPLLRNRLTIRTPSLSGPDIVPPKTPAD